MQRLAEAKLKAGQRIVWRDEMQSGLQGWMPRDSVSQAMQIGWFHGYIGVAGKYELR